MAKPAEFDLEAWVAGKVTQTDTVEVSAKSGLVKQLGDLVDEHARLLKETDKPTRRMAEKPADADAVAEQIRAVAEELDGSWLTVDMRAPTPTERRKSQSAGKEEEEKVAAMLAITATVRPSHDDDADPATLDQAGWLQIFDAIGANQYQRVAEAMAVLAYGKGVTPGFSQRALSYLETRSSSKS